MFKVLNNETKLFKILYKKVIEQIEEDLINSMHKSLASKFIIENDTLLNSKLPKDINFYSCFIRLVYSKIYQKLEMKNTKKFIFNIFENSLSEVGQKLSSLHPNLYSNNITIKEQEVEINFGTSSINENKIGKNMKCKSINDLNNFRSHDHNSFANKKSNTENKLNHTKSTNKSNPKAITKEKLLSKFLSDANDDNYFVSGTKEHDNSSDRKLNMIFNNPHVKINKDDKIQINNNIIIVNTNQQVDDLIGNFKNKKMPGSGNLRIDRRGVIIKKGGKKHKCTYADQIYCGKRLVEVVEVTAFKKFNMENTYNDADMAKAKNSLACCKII
jgi:hypothetical protein